MDRRYLLISPCRDEARYMRTTLDSVLKQTVLPAKWVIVDDGSTDETPMILAEYEREHDFITVVRREDRGRREVGAGVIDAFNAGYRTVQPHDYPYLCKLDLDLDLPERYFETLIERMEADPRLGTCSGKPYMRDPRTGQLVSEKCGDEMSVGMTKFYRTSCFEQIGGFVRGVMWDGIDCHRCRMLGWKAWSWDDPGIRFVHLRPMGSSQQSIWVGRMRHGRGQYFMGTSFPFMTVSALYRMTRPPLVVGGLAMWWGYMRCWIEDGERYDDPLFRRFLRWYQRRSLMKGKRAAAHEIDQRLADIWSRRQRIRAASPS
jgi:poly-beta-1,6-N-acetyl-D-glucosamine synthase